jgi:Ca2+/Na+ antiporter
VTATASRYNNNDLIIITIIIIIITASWPRVCRTQQRLERAAHFRQMLCLVVVVMIVIEMSSLTIMLVILVIVIVVVVIWARVSVAYRGRAPSSRGKYRASTV